MASATSVRFSSLSWCFFRPSLRIATLDTNSWTTCTASYADGEINVTCSDTYRFFQVFYNGTIMDEFMLTVNAPVKLMNALYLKGEDSVVYQITVSGGVISATAVQ